jgi:signal recognition particle receptor subunit beta
MALFDYTAGELIAKVVYYGPDGAGKTTNLRRIHDGLPPGSKGDLALVTRPTGNTLVFDFLPPDAGRGSSGLRTRFQLCALSGIGPSLAARRGVLKGADAVVFVADSQARALPADEQCLEGLYRSLPRAGGDAPAPIVIQYNKRDLATALPFETLNQKLNPRGLPSFEAVAIQGVGVEETLRVALRLCSRVLAALHVKAKQPPTAPGRVLTPQSLARESLDLSPNPLAANRAALRLDRHELFGPPRGDAESSTKAPPKAPGSKRG